MRMCRLGMVALAFSVASCDHHHSNPGTTQVVARVNGKEITILQLNAALGRVPNLTANTAKAAAGPILENLINEELLVQKAEALKLDRNPQVVLAMDAAKRSVLATAYLQQSAAEPAKPVESDIHDYYTQHPEYFAARHVYTYRFTPVIATPEDVAAIEQQMAASPDFDALLATLRARKVNFVVNSASKSAEELSPAVAIKIAALKDGETAGFPLPGGIEILQRLSSRSEPVSEDQATPFIEKFLLEQRRRERIDEEVKALHSAASIQYTGELKAPVVKAAPPAPGVTDVTTNIANGLK